MSGPTQVNVPGYVDYDVDTVMYDGAYLNMTRAVLAGTKWATGNLTYSFPDGTTSYESPYGSYGSAEWTSGWYALRNYEQNAATDVLHAYERVANLHFTLSDDNASVVGDLRFAISNYLSGGSGQYAYAYYPGYWNVSGDVWFSTSWMNNHAGWTTSASSYVGTYDFHSIMHEVGHALGLKHPFSGDNVLPADLDSRMFTVMSYSTFEGDLDSGADRYPTTPMYYDIIALEALYGPSTMNSGNNTYTYESSGKYWETLVDGGGIDTLVYNSAPGEITRFSLKSGDYSEFGLYIDYFNAAVDSDSRTVWIGPSTVIENAKGGPGLETIIGNSAANQIYGNGGKDKVTGNAGADTLYGNGGSDNLAGGTGADTLFGNDGGDRLAGGAGKDRLNGGAGADKFIFDETPVSSSLDTIADFTVGEDKILLDHTVFTRLVVGALPGAEYKEGGSVDSKTTGDGQSILYDPDSGNLYYDSNGATAGGMIKIATLAHAPDISSASITVI